jgi:hypothetical protein
MQIDFHHGVTYVLARLAGFSHDQAAIVGYCAQYVDDATNEGLIRFDNGFLYDRISSAHKMLDYRNLEELSNHHVWIPFHFLPGNGGLPAGQVPTGAVVDRLICRPNSLVAQEMVRDCIADRHAPYGLHRLGITMHVYADTWAHQGFAGVNDAVNNADQLQDANGQPDRNLIDRITSFFIGEALPLGHGPVLSHPDKPYLRWGYTNGRGDKIWRDNPKDYLSAAEHLCQAMQRYRLGDWEAEVPGLLAIDRDRIADLMTQITDRNGATRHRKWQAAIADGTFSFGPATISYTAKGKGSWKHLALGTESAVDRGDEIYAYHPEFLTSDWKQFHDALQIHRISVLHNLLPKYGLCAA